MRPLTPISLSFRVESFMPVILSKAKDPLSAGTNTAADRHSPGFFGVAHCVQPPP